MPRHLLEAGVSNPKGHFEGRQIVWLNDQILRQLGRSWDDPRPIPQEAFQGAAFDLTADVVASCIESEFEGAPSLMVVKDPRICLLAPIWIEAVRRLQAELHVFLPFRAPAQVAASLMKRDGKETGLALALWSRYVLDAEYHSRGMRRAFFDADDFVRDPAAVLRRAGETAAMPWPIPGNEIRNVLGNFVEAGLLSKRADGDTVADTAQVEIYRELMKLKSDPHDAEAQAAFDGFRSAATPGIMPPPAAPQVAKVREGQAAPAMPNAMLTLQKVLLKLSRHRSLPTERLRNKMGRFAIKRILRGAWKGYGTASG
ncbi:sulfotransferase family protein [Labrys monachus]|uniref:Uncharacterized protein n=1 Tax=Labrys monachus TaxID=217067 RepID=A0ABU0FJA6_9HYPH|nr:hypothetical protein [Labrys monachus]MDQ0394611.1 hypothetical protein [Labrys monachus]